MWQGVPRTCASCSEETLRYHEEAGGSARPRPQTPRLIFAVLWSFLQWLAPVPPLTASSKATSIQGRPHGPVCGGDDLRGHLNVSSASTGRGPPPLCYDIPHGRWRSLF